MSETFNNELISGKEYLDSKSIAYIHRNGQLNFNCPVSDCDAGSRPDEHHFYMNEDTTQCDCKKCGFTGNLVTLAKALGDPVESLYKNQQVKEKSKDEITPEKVESLHELLPYKIREYLNKRGIANEIIEKYKIGWGKFYGKWWITIPVLDINGNYILLKLRKNPFDDSNPIKYKVYPTKRGCQIFGIEQLQAKPKRLVLVEGEFDSLIAIANGIVTISSTGGAKTFKPEWVDLFDYDDEIEIYVYYDNDEEGKSGAINVLKKLSRNKRLKLYLGTLPDEVGEKGDLTNYFIDNGGTTEELFTKYAKPFEVPSNRSKKTEEGDEQVRVREPKNRIAKIEKPSKPITYIEWISIIKKNFPECAFAAEVIASVIVQILILDITNPCAVVLIDVPSAGKTITLNFFSGIGELTYSTDKFTPASFVSNATNVKAEKLAEVDLLPKIQYLMLIIRELAPLFGEREDDLLKNIAILTRILDGEGYQTDTGVHGRREYTGEYLFMFVAGSTPIQPRVWKLMGNLGSRMFFLHLNSPDKTEDELVEQLVSASHKTKEQECQQATKDFLYSIWAENPLGIKWDKRGEERELLIIVAKCAKLLARLRGVINVWKSRDDDGAELTHTTPVIEKPNRINQLFYNLCRGHAVLEGRRKITSSDLKPIIELAVDSAPTERAQLFRKLLSMGGKMTTSEIMNALLCSRPTALKEMEKLKILGVVYYSKTGKGTFDESEKEIKLSSDLEWFLSDECKKIRGLSLTLNQNTESDSLNQSNQLIKSDVVCDQLSLEKELTNNGDLDVLFKPERSF